MPSTIEISEALLNVGTKFSTFRNDSLSEFFFLPPVLYIRGKIVNVVAADSFLA
jgi:hypothetical protein